MEVVHVTAENFEEEVVNADKPVLIDFWAPWCGPCKMLLPIIDEIAAMQDKVKVCKVNGDEEGDLIMQFKVRSIPTLVVLDKGVEVNRSVGFKSKAEVLELISVK